MRTQTGATCLVKCETPKRCGGREILPLVSASPFDSARRRRHIHVVSNKSLPANSNTFHFVHSRLRIGRRWTSGDCWSLWVSYLQNLLLLPLLLLP